MANKEISEEQKRLARSIRFRQNEAVQRLQRTTLHPIFSTNVEVTMRMRDNGLDNETIAHGLAIPVEEVTGIITALDAFTATIEPLRAAEKQWQEVNGVQLEDWLIDSGEEW